MIIVTGGAGFVGSNLVRALDRAGAAEVLVVDVADHEGKVANLASCRHVDLVPPERFRRMLGGGRSPFGTLRAVVHQGARSSTLDSDVQAVMDTNVVLSTELLDATQRWGAPLVYASSASVYGTSLDTAEDGGHERPLSTYARSKDVFDRVVRGRLPEMVSQVVGLRYFNVYGPGEDHKGPMASMVTQMDDRLLRGEAIELFGAGCGKEPGEHARDFVHVDDVAAVVIWFLEHPEHSGIFNCGTGVACSFNELAAAVIAARGDGEVRYVPLPEGLAAQYQAYTRADLRRLRSLGYDGSFRPIEVGVGSYLASREPLVGDVRC